MERKFIDNIYLFCGVMLTSMAVGVVAAVASPIAAPVALGAGMAGGFGLSVSAVVLNTALKVSIFIYDLVSEANERAAFHEKREKEANKKNIDNELTKKQENKPSASKSLETPEPLPTEATKGKQIKFSDYNGLSASTDFSKYDSPEISLITADINDLPDKISDDPGVPVNKATKREKTAEQSVQYA